MKPESDLKGTPWEYDSSYTESTNSKDLSFPISFKASIFFFIISLAVLIPIINAHNSTKDGFAGAGEGWAILIVGLYISFPASILSLICGLFALQKTKKSFFTIIPTALFIGYICISFYMLSQQ